MFHTLSSLLNTSLLHNEYKGRKPTNVIRLYRLIQVLFFYCALPPVTEMEITYITSMEPPEPPHHRNPSAVVLEVKDKTISKFSNTPSHHTLVEIFTSHVLLEVVPV